MSETKEMVKLYSNFESKYGLDLVEDLKLLMSRIYMKMNDLEKSRNNWKEKYKGVNKNVK